MKNFLLVNFDEIWPKTLYYSTGTWARFWSNFPNDFPCIIHYIGTPSIITKCSIKRRF